MALASRIDDLKRLKHYFGMGTLAEIEKAVEKLSPQQKHELMVFLGAQLRGETNGQAPRNRPPAERAADLRRWAAGHEPGPGLPDAAVGRDAIYD